jgi:hypothetical protein
MDFWLTLAAGLVILLLEVFTLSVLHWLRRREQRGGIDRSVTLRSRSGNSKTITIPNKTTKSQRRELIEEIEQYQDTESDKKQPAHALK